MNTASDNSFLGSVAAFCCGNESPVKLSDLTMVVPNKRAAMFLKSHVRKNIKGIAMLPRFMTMRTFIDILSDAPETADLPELFILYDAYRKVLARKGRHESVREFDRFIFWGDMMISDFDDIDKALASADDIFKNLRNVKEIQADYLNEDQKNVVTRIWGESRLTAEIEEFWIHLADTDNSESLSSKFLYLWEILGDIYKEFKKTLAERNLMSAGGQFRNAVENLRADNAAISGKYAFIGFNDPTIAETVIFEHLKKKKLALFFWDTAPLALCNGTSMPKTLQRLRELARNFPNPDRFRCSGIDKQTIDVTAIPSNVAQAKATGPLLEQWAKEGLFDPENPINTAIVIPDPGLLLPTLLSLPETIKSINISLGLPYRTTTFATLLHSIISMQLRARRIHGLCNFFYEDVVAVLQHPHIRAVASDDADKITQMIEEKRLFNIAALDIVKIAPNLNAVFTPILNLNDAQDVSVYLDRLLGWLGEALSLIKADNPAATPGFELNAIDYFRKELEKLTSLVEEHRVGMSERTFMQLFERVFASRALALSGKPLQGLQILGVLETRVLDFDNVIILSMNEGIFPKRQYAKTMIPNNLRNGYGLPDFENLERTYAYCFYRLLARAKRMSIFYDARSDGKGNGERSRYIEQVKHLMPSRLVREHTLSVSATKSPTKQFIIHKDEKILSELNRLKPGGNLKISAAALKEYLNCPLSFYLKYVRNLRSNDEMVNYLTASDYGNIVHRSIEKLFEPYKNQIITETVYDQWLSEGNDTIEQTVRAQLIEDRFHTFNNFGAEALDAETTIALRTISAIVRADLRAEKDKYCSGGTSFTFLENEKYVNTLKLGLPWKIDNSLSINFTMSIDRVDSIAPGMLRFIDYKTGEENTSVSDITGLFNRKNSSWRGMFQVMTYCEAYLSIVDEDCDIATFIHPMKELTPGGDIPTINIKRKEVSSYKKDVRESFKPLLHNLLHEIFDETVPFTQREDDSGCTYCDFRSLCGRIKTNEY